MKYWSNGVLAVGQQHHFTFDDIGNRKTAAHGGNEWGTELRTEQYNLGGLNYLNQIDSRTVPGYVNVMGVSSNTATVTVNGQKAARQGHFWRTELRFDNTSAALWPSITNLSVTPQSGSSKDLVTNITGNVWLPQTPETFSYDADGNMTRDGRWTNTFNAENRLTSQVSSSTAPTGSKCRLDFTYDYRGRMIQRIVSPWNGSVYVANETNKFLWDDNVITAQLDGNNNVVAWFIRGLDLSGTMQGAGGAGGLLAVSAGTNGVHFAAHDGNGNLTALVNAQTGTYSQQLDYDPFGVTTRNTGPMASVNRIGFSGQWTDPVSGYVFYLYRPYLPWLGMWPSRDPIEEQGGLNLYAAFFNNPLTYIDRNGLDNWSNPGMGQNAPPPFPQTPSPGLSQQVIDAANQQFDYAMDSYLDGANALQYSREYGPNEPWTQAIRQEYQSHFDISRIDIRRSILDYCCGRKKDGILNKPQRADYSLNNLTPGENADIFFGDILRYTGISSKLQRTGSFNAFYTITGIDCGTKCAKVSFRTNDRFRFGSMTRIPMTGIELGADNPNGSYRSRFNTVYLAWHWDETVCLKK